MSIEEADEIVAIARRGGLRVFCCMTNRYRTDVKQVKLEIEAGTIGIPKYVRASWLRSAGIPRSQGAVSAGVLWDLGSHLVDLVLWLTDWSELTAWQVYRTKVAPSRQEHASWYGFDSAEHLDLERSPDTAVLSLVFGQSGAAHLEASWAAHVPYDHTEILIVGSASAIRLTSVFGWSPARQWIPGPAVVVADKERGYWKPLVFDQDRKHTEYVAQLEYFFDSLETAQWSHEDLLSVVRYVEVLARAESKLNGIRQT
jgi:predicted dehydrogenase